MRRILVGSALGALVIGCGMSAALAGGTYHLDVSVLGLDGSVAAHQRFTCQVFETCQNTMTAPIAGKPVKFGVRAVTPNDENHVRVMLEGGGQLNAPFMDTTDYKPLKAGNAWTTTLTREIHHRYDRAADKAGKWKPFEYKTIGKVRFKIEN